MPNIASIKKQIERKGLELEFSKVGFAALREAQACIDDPDVLKAIDWAIA